MQIQRNKKRIIVGAMLSLMALSAVSAVGTETPFIGTVSVFADGIDDVGLGTASDDVENMISVGKSIMGSTPYVYGGGHSDWEEQRDKDVPTGLDSSAYVSWVLYRGMGIDMGYAPIPSQYKEFFDEVNATDMDDVERGDLILDDTTIEIYLGEKDGKYYSLGATNDRGNISIIETNWGKGLDGKTVIRPSVDDAQSGKNGLGYAQDAVINLLGERAMGGDIKTTASQEDLEKLIAEARKYLDYPYVWGGESTSEGGFDCSGLMFRIFDDVLDVKLPRTSKEQLNYGKAIDMDDIQAGDLIYWTDSSGDVYHVALYIGNDKILEAANPDIGLREAKLYDNGDTLSANRIVDFGGETSKSDDSEESNTTDFTASEEDLFAWLNPIVDFSGDSDSHAKSTSEGKSVDGTNKGLKGDKDGFFKLLF